MRFNPWHLVLPLVVAAVLAALVGLHTAASASCGEADANRNHGLFTTAEKQYAAIFEDEPDSSCAADGMQRVIDHRCEKAARLADAGANEEARKVYLAILAIEPTHLKRQCAITGLARLPTGGGDMEACPCGEVNDPDPDDPEVQEAEVQEPERQEPERQEPERQEPERQESERQEPERQEPERQEPERQEPERQEPERQEPERQEPERQEPGGHKWPG